MVTTTPLSDSGRSGARVILARPKSPIFTRPCRTYDSPCHRKIRRCSHMQQCRRWVYDTTLGDCVRSMGSDVICHAKCYATLPTRSSRCCHCVQPACSWLTANAWMSFLAAKTRLLLAVPHDQDVGRLQVAVDEPVLLHVAETVEQLPHDGLDHRAIHRRMQLVAVVPQHLVQVVLRVIERQRKARVLRRRTRPVRSLTSRRQALSR